MSNLVFYGKKQKNLCENVISVKNVICENVMCVCERENVGSTPYPSSGLALFAYLQSGWTPLTVEVAVTGEASTTRSRVAPAQTNRPTLDVEREIGLPHYDEHHAPTLPVICCHALSRLPPWSFGPPLSSTALISSLLIRAGGRLIRAGG